MSRMISSGSSRAANNEITLIQLKDPAFVSLLKEFKILLMTSIGIEGGLKLLVSGGGYMQISSSSRQIFQYYDQFESPIIQFIVQVIKGQTDYGLYCGVIISSCLEHLLYLQYCDKITSANSSNLITSIMKYSNELFDSNNLKIEVDFNSVISFIPLVRSVLESKCKKLLICDSFISVLSCQIIKAFLSTLDTDNLMVGKIMVRVFKGNDRSKFYPGIVYELVDGDDWISDLVMKQLHQKSELKTILFTTSLDNKDNMESKLLYRDKLSVVTKILDEISKLGVDIVACQKTVHCDIKLQLRRKSIIVLERMGTELASNFEQLTDSFPISNIDELNFDDVASMIGVINKVSTLEIGTNCFLLIERFSASIATLFVEISCLVHTQQMKTIVEQALVTLRELVNNPYVCPGAGCFEVCLCANIQALDKGDVIGKELHWLLRTFVEAVGLKLPIWIDTLYRHAWSSEDQLKCNCQLLSRDLISDNNGSYQIFSSNEPFDFNFDLYDNSKCVKKLSENAVVDLFVLKRNSVISAFETCINLLGIGTVIQINK